MSFFTENLAGQNVADHHLITTSHPYMIELGLGSMTTGTLYNWWNKQNSQGRYYNRAAINQPLGPFDDLSGPTRGLQYLLGLTENTPFTWYGWQPNKQFQNTGKYVKFDLSDFSGGSDEQSIPWEYSTWWEVTTDDWTNLDGVVFDNAKPIIGGKLRDDGITFEPEKAAANLDLATSLYPVYDICQLNRYMNAFTDYNPRSIWDKDEDSTAGVSTREVFAAHEFLNDIKSSKRGPFIQWSGEVTFFTSLDCPLGITEWIPFKLHLFDRSKSSAENKTLTVKNLTYVAPKRDVAKGRRFATAEDGGFQDVDIEDTARHGAGEMDLHYNEVVKKWEGGTPQLFAKLVTDVGVPQGMPSVEHFESNDIAQDLDSDEFETTKVIAASGTAMPIRPQNGNVNQWQPNYVDPEDVRCDKENKTEKETVTVYNFNSQRNYKRDEEVIISRIDGCWHIIPLHPSSGIDEDSAVTSSVGKWGEFTYMLTNDDFFFQSENFGSFTPREAELSYHFDYYSEQPDQTDRDLNTGVDYGVEGGYDRFNYFNTFNAKLLLVPHSYWQVTSFDFLDSRLFGRRGTTGPQADKCAYATTQYTTSAAGFPIPGPNQSLAERNAAHAGTFFGCVFPDGYTGTEPYFNADGRDFTVAGANQLSDRRNFPDDSVYYNTGGDTRSNNPFLAVNATSDRNNCRNPIQGAPLDAFQDENGDYDPQKWYRRNPGEAAANLFAENVINRETSFRQMPADVMLNASPKGENGSPLYSVHRWSDVHRPNEFGDSWLVAARISTAGSWLRKEGDASQYNENDSAFDFQPIQRNKLMFRPMKMEGYVQFGGGLQFANFKEATEDKVLNQNDRTTWSVEAFRTQLDSHRPCDYGVNDREIPRLQARTDNNVKLYDDDFGLRWGGDVTNKRFYNQLHEFSYWTDGMEWNKTWTGRGGGNWKGAGAYGIITTYNTIAANKRIEFTTDNSYGMSAAGHGRFTIEDGLQYQDKTWGNTSFQASYKQQNIIDLSVRIYAQHPRDQTLFDPRTFAVHHFNPDMRDHFTFSEGYARLEDDGTVTEVAEPRLVQSQDINGRDKEGKQITFTYSYPVPSSVVDFKIPSRFAEHIDNEFNEGNSLHAANGSYVAQALSPNTIVLKNATVDSDKTGNIEPPVIADKFWGLNFTRLGKLLPYRYYSQEIGVPTPTGLPIQTENLIRRNDLSDENDGPRPVLGANGLADELILDGLGQNYIPGDTVGIASKGAIFEVTEVYDAGFITDQGAIKTLVCIDRGTNFKAGQCAGSGDIITNETEGPLKLSTINSANGTGFSAYFVNAKVYNKINTDPKPKLLRRDGQDITRIAADIPGPTHDTSGYTNVVDSEAFVEETREVSFIIDPLDKSENSQYDLFFHFHNDITMTWLASSERFHGNFQNPTEICEQGISVNINPV